jgi:hypothetical protein
MFKITIEEVKIVKKMVKGAWVRFADEPKENNYGYAPDREDDVMIEKQIFIQSVETLDLISVIKAINGIK